MDAYKGGWVIARWDPDGAFAFQTASTFADVLRECSDVAVLGVDIPLALPRRNLRRSDEELRAHLGPAARSLFFTPTRAAAGTFDPAEAPAASHAAAVVANRASGGKGPSIQGWNLMPKVIEARHELLTRAEDGGLEPPVWEVHPESSFVTMAQEAGRQLPLASKKSGRGVGERLALLSGLCGFDPLVLAEVAAGTGVDDCLDAAANAWTCARVLQGTARWFGPRERDDEGLPLSVPT